MASVINTNIASLNAQRNMTKSQNTLNTSLQRLSSGLRINSAKDDAAGLAISERMTAQIRGLDQAQRNSNDGISLAQTAEGALSSVGDALQRMRELAVQASNATNSASDREALQSEVDQLVQQINTVADQTSFNGVKLLNGTFSSQSFQVGANKGETISISSISSAKADSLGVGTTSSYSTEKTSTVTTGAISAGGITVNGYGVGPTVSDGVSTSTSVNGAAVTAHTTTTDDVAAGDLKINGVSIGAISALTADTAVVAGGKVATAINLLTSQTGVTASADATTGALTLTSKNGNDIKIEMSGTATTARTGLTAGTTAVGTDSAISKAAAFNAVSSQTGVSAVATKTTVSGAAASMTTNAGFTSSASNYIKINGVDIGDIAAGADDVESGNNIAAAINAVSNQTGVTASFSTTNGAVTLTAADGRNITIDTAGTGTSESGFTNGTSYGGIKLNSTSSAGITFGGADLSKTALTAGYTAATSTFGAGVSSIDLSTADGAQNALGVIDSALANINSSRANLGAIQNRFSNVVSNLSTSSENLTAARSRIQDTDFAAETANLTKAQILQQAGTAMLAQAKSLPQSVLSLLQ